MFSGFSFRMDLFGVAPCVPLSNLYFRLNGFKTNINTLIFSALFANASIFVENYQYISMITYCIFLRHSFATVILSLISFKWSAGISNLVTLGNLAKRRIMTSSARFYQTTQIILIHKQLRSKCYKQEKI